jgi:glycosyltransferase involved in cell wall biosynthesis
MATISIITVCYNSEFSIEDTIKSVTNQKYRNIEYIIIDGLSTDNTINILKRNSHWLDKVISEKDNGIYDAMNKGIARATGDIIGFINSDDILADNSVLQQIAQAFHDNPSAEACYGDLCYVKKNDLNQTMRYWRSRPYQPGLFNKGWVPPHPTLYVRREVYERYGPFDLKFHIASDFELMLRFIEVYRISVVYLPHVLVKMRLGGTTNKSLKNIYKQNTEIRQAIKMHNLKFSLCNFIFYKAFSRFLQFTRRPSLSRLSSLK